MSASFWNFRYMSSKRVPDRMKNIYIIGAYENAF